MKKATRRWLFCVSPERLLLGSSSVGSLLGGIGSGTSGGGASGGSGSSASSGGGGTRSSASGGGSSASGSVSSRGGGSRCGSGCGSRCSGGSRCGSRCRLFFFTASGQGCGSNQGRQYERFLHFRFPYIGGEKQFPEIVTATRMVAMDRPRRTRALLVSLKLYAEKFASLKTRMRTRYEDIKRCVKAAKWARGPASRRGRKARFWPAIR